MLSNTFHADMYFLKSLSPSLLYKEGCAIMPIKSHCGQIRSNKIRYNYDTSLPNATENIQQWFQL